MEIIKNYALHTLLLVLLGHSCALQSGPGVLVCKQLYGKTITTDKKGSLSRWGTQKIKSKPQFIRQPLSTTALSSSTFDRGSHKIDYKNLIESARTPNNRAKIIDDLSELDAALLEPYRHYSREKIRRLKNIYKGKPIDTIKPRNLETREDDFPKEYDTNFAWTKENQ